MVEAADIDKPDEAYSIEDAKLKTEEDARRELAELNKGKQRERISELRARYMSLVEVSLSSFLVAFVFLFCILFLRLFPLDFVFLARQPSQAMQYTVFS